MVSKNDAFGSDQFTRCVSIIFHTAKTETDLLIQMPISPENAKRYPANWKEIVAQVRERSGNRCEGSPVYPDCRVGNSQTHPVTGSTVVLTTGHLDHTPENCSIEDLSNLKHWCQRCHLTYDAKHHAQTAYMNRRCKGTEDWVSDCQGQR